MDIIFLNKWYGYSGFNHSQILSNSAVMGVLST